MAGSNNLKTGLISVVPNFSPSKGSPFGKSRCWNAVLRSTSKLSQSLAAFRNAYSAKSSTASMTCTDFVA